MNCIGTANNADTASIKCSLCVGSWTSRSSRSLKNTPTTRHSDDAVSVDIPIRHDSIEVFADGTSAAS